MQDSAEARLSRQLEEIVRATPWLMAALRTARGLHLPDWYIGAGAIRNTVWDRLHGFPAQPSCSDIDLVYFALNGVRDRDTLALQGSISQTTPGMPWELVNQAYVHEWDTPVGVVRSPLKSCIDGIGTWPETATAVGVRLEQNDGLTIAAPCGLADLFALRLRWNPRHASHEEFLQRVQEKRFLSRWPRLSLADTTAS